LSQLSGLHSISYGTISLTQHGRIAVSVTLWRRQQCERMCFRLRDAECFISRGQHSWKTEIRKCNFASNLFFLFSFSFFLGRRILFGELYQMFFFIYRILILFSFSISVISCVLRFTWSDGRYMATNGISHEGLSLLKTLSSLCGIQAWRLYFFLQWFSFVH
jgi:hypothetical protein